MYFKLRPSKVHQIIRALTHGLALYALTLIPLLNSGLRCLLLISIGLSFIRDCYVDKRPLGLEYEEGQWAYHRGGYACYVDLAHAYWTPYLIILTYKHTMTSDRNLCLWRDAFTDFEFSTLSVVVRSASRQIAKTHQNFPKCEAL